jgi:hypothetical protein
MPDEAQRRIEAYLRRVRARLRGLNPPDIREIVEELRSHILDQAASGEDVTVAAVDKALVALGTPEELATSTSPTTSWLVRKSAEVSGVRSGKSLSMGKPSAASFLVLLGSVAGYSFGTIFVLGAALKPLHPQNAGCGFLGTILAALQYPLVSGSEPSRESAGMYSVGGLYLSDCWRVAGS